MNRVEFWQHMRVYGFLAACLVIGTHGVRAEAAGVTVGPGGAPRVHKTHKMSVADLKSTEVFTVSSTAVIMGASDDGNWGLWTLEGDPDDPNDDDKRLTYARNGWSNGLAMVVDGELFVLDDETGDPTPYITEPMAWNEDAQAAFITFSVDGLVLQEKLQLVPSSTDRLDTVKATYTVTNPASATAARTFSLKVGIDTMVGNDDAAYVLTPSGYIDSDSGFGHDRGGTVFDDPVPDYWQAFENGTVVNPGLVAQGTLSGGGASPPDMFVVGDWTQGVSLGAIFDYSPSGETFADGAVGMWWFNRTLSPGESIRFVIYYGMGDVPAGGTDLGMSLSSQDLLTNSGSAFVPDPLVLLVQLQNNTGGTLEAVPVTLSLPSCLEVADGEGLTRSVGPFVAGGVQLLTVELSADPACAGQTATYSVIADSGGALEVQLSKDVALPLMTCEVHAADQNGDWQIQVSPELTRLIQFYNSGGYHCQAGTEDGYAPGPGVTTCAPHSADQNGDWQIQVSPELTRIIQFYNSGGYHCEEGTEDGYAPGVSAGR